METLCIIENFLRKTETRPRSKRRLVINQGFRKAFDNCKWRAQLVRNIGHEFPAHDLEYLQLSNIVQDQKR